MKVLTVLSNTHYGRGTPHTNEENRESIRIALQAIEDIIVFDSPVFGFGDEDWGWMVSITEELYAKLLKRFPDSMAEGEYLYVHNAEAGKYADEFEVSTGGKTMAVIEDWNNLPQFKRDALVGPKASPPVERSFDAFYINWFENYGKY
jgi:hypothetical protein